VDNKVLKIIIADDHKIYREGLKAMINFLGYAKVIAEAENGFELLDIIEKNESDIIITDIVMPGMNGIEATQAALKKNPALKIFVLSSFESEEYIHDLLEAGVKGYGLKHIGLDEFDLALKLIMQGNIYLAKELQDKIHNLYLHTRHKNILFTDQELKVLGYIVEGLSSKEIADLMNKGKRTIDGYREILLKKTGCHNSKELITYAINNKIFGK
jgi:DNA-binding NarL/FixJ family response regulator